MEDIHIRIVSPVVRSNRGELADQKALPAAGFQLTKRHVAEGASSIESLYDSALSVPQLLKLAVEAEQEGADAIVIDCMADPGLLALRERVKIPVFGPSQTSMHLAGLLGHRFAVVTLMRRLKTLFDTAASTYGVATSMVNCRWIDLPVHELAANAQRTAEAILKEAIAAIKIDKADAIILGCTGLLGLADAVRSGLLDAGYDVPVIDPLPATVQQARSVVSAGLSHSKVAYPLPKSVANSLLT